MGVVGLRESKRATTERAIVDSAMKLFAERGFASTTVDEIAALAGVGRRTVFRYFRTKEDILLDPRRLDRSYAMAALRHRQRQINDVDLVMAVLVELQRRAFAVFRPEHQRLLHQLSHREPAVAARSFLLMLEAANVVSEALIPSGASSKERLRARLLAMTCIVAVDAGVTAWVEGGMRGDLDAMLAETGSLLRRGFRR